MFDALKSKVVANVLAGALRSLATSKDTQASITGIIAGVVLAIPGLDLGKLLAGDPQQIAHLVAGLLVAWLGWLAGKPGHDGTTTVLGVIAGTLQASSGQIHDITAGVVVAVLGHVTNMGSKKPAVVPKDS